MLGLAGSVVQEDGDVSSARPDDQLKAGVPGWQSPGHLCSRWFRTWSYWLAGSDY